MGTRNLTRVIDNGELKVCQYGQWDGYPIYTGRKVLEFVRNGKYDAVKGCKLNITYGGARYYTGAPATAEVEEAMLLHQKIMYNDGLTLEEAKAKADKTVIDELGEDAFLGYLAASRDTGANILSISKPIDLYADEYLVSVEEPNNNIKAVNIVDFDNETVTMKWKDKTTTYTFAEIQVMDIDKEMRAFEGEESWE